MPELSRDTDLDVLFQNATRDGNVAATGADVSEHDSAMIVLDVTGYTDGSHTFRLVESNDDATYSDPPQQLSDSDVSVSAASDTGKYILDYAGNAPFVGIKRDASASGDTCTFGVYLVKSDKARTG